MKYLLVLCAFFVVAFAQEQYSDKYDNLDVDEIMGNERLFAGYSDCILDKGPCTAEGKDLKDHIQEALETECSKCSNKQKDTTVRVIKKLISDHLDVWNEVSAKYDPTGKWRNEYRERAKAEYGIDVPAK